MRVNIEKLIYGGEGLARLAPDAEGRRKTLFVPFTIDGEETEVRVSEERPSFIRGLAEQCISPSQHRIEPGCHYFFRCGGCQYQHIEYAHQLATKAAILRETVTRIAKTEIPGDIEVHAGEPWQYRNRTRVHVQSEPEFAIGYHRANSNELLPVEMCPISSPLINRAIKVIWQAGRSGAIPHGIDEIQFFVDHADSQLLLEFFVVPATGDLAPTWNALKRELPELAGLVVFPAPLQDQEESRAPLSVIAPKQLASFGTAHLNYTAGEHTYRVSGGAFFQTNRFLMADLLRIVIGEHSGDSALDLYSGVGLFTIQLAQRFKQVIAVESSTSSFRDLQRNAPPNVQRAQQRVDEFLRTYGKKQCDYVVVDPPRAGLGEKVAKALARINTRRVTYVSCEPSTLSRDLRILLQSGFHIKKAHLVDLFPQTFHMESVFELAR